MYNDPVGHLFVVNHYKFRENLKMENDQNMGGAMPMEGGEEQTQPKPEGEGMEGTPTEGGENM